MTIYLPAAVILSEYTDDALRSADSPWAAPLRDLLLTIPAEYRQPAAAEQHRRSTRTSYVDTKAGFLAQSESVRPAMETWREVVAEVAAQVATAGAR